MSEQDLFNTPSDELKRLVDELRVVKEALREVSKRLAQIDMRMRRSFPTLFPEHSTKRDRMQSSSDQPTLTPEQATQLYEELVTLAQNDKQSSVHDRLSAVSLPDLNLLRRELGATIGKKKPSRKALEDAILGRIRESVMLTRHANREKIIQQTGDSGSLPEINSEEE
jgi:hypothetical protein